MSDYTAERFADLEQQNRAFAERLAAAQAEARAASEEIAAMQRAAQRQAFAEEAQSQHLAEDEYVAVMEALTPEQRTRVRSFYDPIVAQRNAGGLFTTYGIGGRGERDAESEMASLVAARRQQQPALSYAQAYSEVLAQNPALYERLTGS